jgi:hypothetical protein
VLAEQLLAHGLEVVDKIALRGPGVVEQRLIEVSQRDVLAVVHARPLYDTSDRPHDQRPIVTFGVSTAPTARVGADPRSAQRACYRVVAEAQAGSRRAPR